uniref:Uncharacterized protein n=1 Tax=Rhizophora mucronata TaxID=61149 RepID=A0A2P2PR13_RHIMU
MQFKLLEEFRIAKSHNLTILIAILTNKDKAGTATNKINQKLNKIARGKGYI